MTPVAFEQDLHSRLFMRSSRKRYIQSSKRAKKLFVELIVVGMMDLVFQFLILWDEGWIHYPWARKQRLHPMHKPTRRPRECRKCQPKVLLNFDRHIERVLLLFTESFSIEVNQKSNCLIQYFFAWNLTYCRRAFSITFQLPLSLWTATRMKISITRAQWSIHIVSVREHGK